MKSPYSVWVAAFLYLSPVLLPARILGSGSPDVVLAGDRLAIAQTDVAILDRARAASANAYSALQSFVCTEQIDRFRGDITGQSVRPLDKIRAKLSFERGVEQYSDVFEGDRARPGISSLTGAWSEGEFGTLLLQTQQLLSDRQVTFTNFATWKDEPAAIYRVEVAAEDSPWNLTVAGHNYQLSFTTSVWVSVRTGDILKIDRTANHLAPETRISEIQWSITLDHVSLNGAQWLLPVRGTYAVLYSQANHREWNQISFTGYQRYGSQTALKFD